jgi:Heterokaryon incompatibility protein (HET)
MVPKRLDVDIAVRQIRQWLSDCEGHRGCSTYRRSLTILPTRVLDLGKDPESLDPIKLFETGGIEGTYMTLSHRWGPTDFITTTEDTFKQRIAGILLADLPQTFKDAVSLTRNLGIRYLWIDSLCIKQNNKEDWENEASKMGSVYSHSYLNIAATSSAGSDGGCFRERQVVIAQDPSPSAIRSHKIEGTDLGAGRINVRPLLKSAHGALDNKGHSWSSQLSPLVSNGCSWTQPKWIQRLTAAKSCLELGYTKSAFLLRALSIFMQQKCSGNAFPPHDVSAAVSTANESTTSGQIYWAKMFPQTSKSSGSQ